MASLPVFLYDAFTAGRYGGNVAGVVVGASTVTPAQMARVARELGAPCTGFVSPAAPGQPVPVRLYTPTRELPFCDHVTVGVFAHLARELGPGRECRFIQVSSGGRRAVTVAWEGDLPLVRVQGDPPRFQSVHIPRGDMAGLLGIPAGDLHPELPQEIAGTGLHHLMVPLRSLAVAARLRPDHHSLARIAGALQVDSVAVFSLEARRPGCQIHLRDFGGEGNAAEEPASGTTCGALCCYLVRHGALGGPGDGTLSLAVEQGEELERPSDLRVWLHVAAGQPVSVEVGGNAVLTLAGELHLD